MSKPKKSDATPPPPPPPAPTPSQPAPVERPRLGCPPQLSTQRRICEHLVDCGRFEESEIDVCVENHRTFTEDAAGCLRCVERTSCDEISSQCEDAC